MAGSIDVTPWICALPSASVHDVNSVHKILIQCAQIMGNTGVSQQKDVDNKAGDWVLILS